MAKVIGLSFVGGFLIGIFLGMVLMCCLVAGSDKE